MKTLATYALFLLAALFFLGALASLGIAHGGEPPEFDNPEISGPCADPRFNYNLGDAQLHGQPAHSYDQPGEWVAYCFENGPPGYTPPENCNDARSVYLTAGELGANVRMHLRSNPITPLPAGSRGFVAWSWNWTPLWWGNWGWSALDLDSIFDVWEFTDAERWILNGEHIGWIRHYTAPTDPGLIGLRIYFQAAITDAVVDTGEMSETWSHTFTDVLP